MFRKLIGSGIGEAIVVPPSLRQTYGNKHTSLATAGYIWVTNTGTHTIQRIDTTTLVVTEYTTGGLTPAGITFDGTHLYISHYSSNTIVKMTTGGVIVATFTIGQGLHQIAFDGTDLWVNSYAGGKVYKLSTTGTVLATYTCGRYPLDIMVAAGKVWVGLFNFTGVSQGVGALLKLNLDGTLDAEYVVGDHPVGLSYDGTNILVTGFLDGNYYVVNPTTGTILNTYSSGVASSTNLDIAYSSYGSYVLLTVSKDYSPYNLPNNYNKVQIRKSTDGSLVEEVQVGIDPRNVSVDEFNYGYIAGYGDGSVTRFLLPSPPSPTYQVLHLLPPSFDNLYQPSNPNPQQLSNVSAVGDHYHTDAAAIIFLYPRDFAEQRATEGIYFKIDLLLNNPITATHYLLSLGASMGLEVTATQIKYSTQSGYYVAVDYSLATATRYVIELYTHCVTPVENTLYIYVNGTLIGSASDAAISGGLTLNGIAIGAYSNSYQSLPSGTDIYEVEILFGEKTLPV